MKIKQYIENFGLWIVSKTSGIPLKSGGCVYKDQTFMYRGLIAELETAKGKYAAYQYFEVNRYRAFDRKLAESQILDGLNKVNSEI